MQGYENFLIQVGRHEIASYSRAVVDEKLKERSHTARRPARRPARRQTQPIFQQRHVSEISLVPEQELSLSLEQELSLSLEQEFEQEFTMDRQDYSLGGLEQESSNE